MKSEPKYVYSPNDHDNELIQNYRYPYSKNYTYRFIFYTSDMNNLHEPESYQGSM